MGLICTKPEVSTKSVNEVTEVNEVVAVKEDVAVKEEVVVKQEEVAVAETVNTDQVNTDQISNKFCVGAGCYWGTEKFYRKTFKSKDRWGNVVDGKVGFMGNHH